MYPFRLVRAAALGACLGVVGWPAQAGGPAWHQWRGPSRDGQVSGADWPAGLGESQLTLQWRVELEPGYSGPLVDEGRVFVTETREARQEVVRALDRATGQQIWEVSWDGALEVPFFAKRNGDWIRATPALSEGTLYVAGMRDLLIALDATTGSERWRVDFPVQLGTPLPDFGFASSPLVDGDYVYVQAGGGFVKLDKHTGQLVWRVLVDDGGMMGSAFSSPVIATLAGRRQLVVQTRERLSGVDAADGAVLWQREIPAFRGMNILTPTIWNDCVFTSAYGGKSLLLRIENRDEGQEAMLLWENKAQGYMSSPVVVDGHLYLHLRNRRFTCLDLATGDTCWTTTPFGEYWSLLAQGNRLLALDQNGELLLCEANPREFTLLDRRRLSDQETWGHLAAAGLQLFVRELRAISAWSLQDEAP